MESHLRIIQVVNVRWFNATAWYGLTLSRLLKDAGHDVLVLGLPGTESFARAKDMGLSPHGLNLNSTNPARLPALMKKMRTIIKDFKPHIVNCHRGEAFILWGLFKAAGYPFALVRTRGDQRPPKANPANKRLHVRLVDALVSTNSRTTRQCAEAFSLPEDRVFTIPGGVDTQFYRHDPAARARVRSALGYAENDCVVGLLGRLDHVKGQKELIDALCAVRNEVGPEKFARIRLMLMGFPTSVSQQEVQGWLHDAQLTEHTVITGKVDDVVGHINAMDLGVIASQGSEAIARAAFEIMACKVPLVGTDVGVMPDLLPPEALAPVASAEDFAALLGKACSSADFRAALQKDQAARMPEFTLPAFLYSTMQVYGHALERLAVR